MCKVSYILEYFRIESYQYMLPNLLLVLYNMRINNYK